MLLTPVIMNETKVDQRFLIENDMEIIGLNISFATYKRQVNSPIQITLIDGLDKIIFSKSINSFNDNTYTKIEMPNVKLDGGMYYRLVLSGHSNNMFNAVALWYDKSAGDTLKVNSRTFENCRVNFKFVEVKQVEEKSNNIIEDVAIEEVVIKKRGRKKKVV